MMSETDRKELFEKSKKLGKIAEEIAKEDYRNEGFRTTDTGRGSDFLASKKLSNSDKLEELVEVKTGKAKLSTKQRSLKRKCKEDGRSYRVYRVNGTFLENYLKNNNKDESATGGASPA